MYSYFERINNRYRGPFEKEKIQFFVSQALSNLTAAFADNNIQKNIIDDMPGGAVAVDAVNRKTSRDSIREILSTIDDMIIELHQQ